MVIKIIGGRQGWQAMFKGIMLAIVIVGLGTGATEAEGLSLRQSGEDDAQAVSADNTAEDSSADICVSSASTPSDTEGSNDEEVPDERIVDEGSTGLDEVAASPDILPGADASLLQKTVKEAELLYLEATRSYESGDAAASQEFYRQSLQKLSAVGPEINYALKDDFNGLFNALNAALEEKMPRPAAPGTRYRIPMNTENELVKKYLKLYGEGRYKEEIRKALERCGKYRAMILRILSEYGLPEELVYLPVVESMYNVNDVSHAGAVGLWQLMPSRARSLGLKINYWIDERKDPEKSTRAAARYLKELYLMFDDWHLALAAYNRGEYGLVRDLRFSNATNIEQISARKAVPRETERFVPQFIACTVIGDNSADYGFELKEATPLSYDTVTIDTIIDLKVVAKCAKTTIAEVRELNPALKAWCTPHNYPRFELHLPPGAKETFLKNIAMEKDLNPSQGFIKYRVNRGDCLSTIARKFATTVRAIREDNKIRNPQALQINQILVIRPGKRYMSAGK